MRLLVALLMAMGMFGTAAGVGRWLVTEDPPQRAHAIVILGGGVPFRPAEGAELYRQKLAPEVWLTQAKPSREEKMLDSLDVGHIPEFEFARRVLVQLGVPAAAVRVLQPAVVNTADEIRAILDAMSSYPESRVIVITSKVHTRRVRTIWRLLGGRPEALVVRFSRNDPYQPGRWWSNTRDVLATMREVGGLLNAWLGFPLRPEER